MIQITLPNYIAWFLLIPITLTIINGVLHLMVKKVRAKNYDEIEKVNESLRWQVESLNKLVDKSCANFRDYNVKMRKIREILDNTKSSTSAHKLADKILKEIEGY